MRADVAVMRSETGPATAEDPLLESRFEFPERLRFMVARPRLTDKLSMRSTMPVTMVVGPAGSGKTQLVASWVTSGAVASTVAWVTLENDDQAYPFWSYVVAALRRAGVAVSPALTPMPSRTTADRSFLIRLAAELSEQRTPILLVLDGVSGLPGERWGAELEFVLRHTSSLRLVLVGRWDPPMPVHRYRLAGRLTEIRSEDLAFTAEEAAELLRMHSVELSADGLASLLAHTEGWAAGLRLFAMALQDHRDADHLVETITGNEATIAEYFVDEVLRVQPVDVRAFLLEISILDTFTPELAEAVSGRPDTRRLLAELSRHNVFVQRVAGHPTAYRLHRLFAELLRAQLKYETSAITPELHRRAATWYAARGLTADAVTHFVRAQDWNGAATTVIDHYAIGRLLLDGGSGRLGMLLRHLPDESDSAEVAIVGAALALAGRSVDGCAVRLQYAQELVIGRNCEFSHGLAVADLILSVLLAEARGERAQLLQMTIAAEQALAQAPPEVAARHPELRMLLLAAKGFASSGLGDLGAACASLTEVAASAAPGCERLRIDALEHLALLEAHSGRLSHAETLAAEAIDIARQCGLDGARAPLAAHVALAWAAMERFQVDAAARHLRAADPRRHVRAGGLVRSAHALVKSRRLQARGELRAALALLDDGTAEKRDPDRPEWLEREIAVARGQLLIIMGRPQDALAAIEGFGEPGPPDVVILRAAALAAMGDLEPGDEAIRTVLASAALPVPVAVDAWLVVATIAARLGQREEACEALHHALRLATPESQRRPVQMVWAHLRRLLRDDDVLAEEYRALQGVSPPAHRATPTAPGPGDLVIVEPLSRREMEVLQGMAAMLPTEEIAASLYVSINTVKTHVRSILRKLSAARRNEAVRRARQLGLI
ncbi:LuxR C-terminal-related transcriptional regulator [Actinoplanes sp. NPDC049548]|uniref:LuxR C-terminal-related transcriptional regulator n=1 Tax=Actinoplanes sp. NPDC049548 TaxID=3155152 RepID=UPI0034441BC2